MNSAEKSDEVEQNPAPQARNDPPQSSLPNGSGRGLSVSIRSSSRENLTSIDPPLAKKQPGTISNAIGSKSSPPSSSSSSSTTTTSVSLQPSVQPTAALEAAAAPQATNSDATTTETKAKTAPAKTTIRKAEVKEPSTTTTKLKISATSSNTMQWNNSATTTTAAAAAGAVAVDGTGEDEEFAELDDLNTPRMNLINWDPKPLLDDLYKIQLKEETAEDISHQFISMEGLMEKLPMNKKKSTLLKTWKRRFFRAQDGWVQYYETGNRDKPSETLQLMGGRIDDMGNRILGIDDGRGRYLMVRAPTDKEHGQWKMALESQTADNTKATYVQPILKSVPHPSKRIVVIDMGSSAIRAGILGEQECLPQVFFPSVVAVHKETGKKVVGAEAYHPDVRRCSTLLHPIRPSNKLDQFNIDVDMMTAIFGKVFTELKVDPSEYMVMLSTPQTLSDSLRAGLMDALVGSLGVQGVCMVQQSLLALYFYRTTSGIIVDIGHRIEILPIYDGFVIESGVARCPYGSQKVIDSLKKALLETNYKFASEVELLLVRHIMEKSCYIPADYAAEETLFATQPGKLDKVVNLCYFGLPAGAYKSVDIGEGRFTSPEGFFNVDLWEMDYPTLHKLIFQAIQSCPMDNRRHMYRAVYLSGGVTMLPGFTERLLRELKRLAPPAVTVEVHAAPNRYHAAYLGACSVAGMPQFKDMAISKEEWRIEGARAFKKWQAQAAAS